MIGRVAALEQVPKATVASIVALGEGALEPFHAGHQVHLRRLQQEVVVAAQEDEGRHPPARFETSLADEGIRAPMSNLNSYPRLIGHGHPFGQEVRKGG